MQFHYQSFSNKVIFGQALVQAINAELADAEPQRFMVIASERFQILVEAIGSLPGVIIAAHLNKVIQHVPESLVAEATQKLQAQGVDTILAIGGGSAIGLAKALALKTAIPVWAAPSTYAGSEMTNMYGITADGKKKVGRNDLVLPQKVFYDTALSLNMPIKLAATSAINALAHLVEALYSSNRNPITHQNALTGIRHLLEGLTELASDQKLSTGSNEKLLLGACLGGKCLCEVSMALHHKAAHVLGGNYSLDHAQTHTVLLPYVLQLQWSHLEQQLQEDFIRVFANLNPPSALQSLAQRLGVPLSLAEIGFEEHHIEAAAAAIAAQQFDNPGPLDHTRLVLLLKNAFSGKQF